MMREDMGILLYPEHNMYISFHDSKKVIIAYAKSSRTLKISKTVKTVFQFIQVLVDKHKADPGTES